MNVFICSGHEGPKGEEAQESIGLTEGIQMAHKELEILLRQYDLYQEQLDLLMSEIERLVSQIPGTPEMMSIPGVELSSSFGFTCRVRREILRMS